MEEDDGESQLDVIDLEIFEDTAYIMARQYDPSVPDTPEEWLENFTTFSIYEILPEILELWAINNKTTATPKKTKSDGPGRNGRHIPLKVRGVPSVWR